MFCPKCGAKALEGAAFCQKCGTKLIIDEEPNGLSTDPAMETSQRTQAILDGQSNTPKTKIFNKRIFGLIGAGLIIVVAVVVVLALKGRTKYPDELLYDGLPVSRFFEMTQEDVDLEFGQSGNIEQSKNGITGDDYFNYNDYGIDHVTYSKENGKVIYVELRANHCTYNGKKLEKTADYVLDTICSNGDLFSGPTDIYGSIFSGFYFFDPVYFDNTDDYVQWKTQQTVDGVGNYPGSDYQLYYVTKKEGYNLAFTTSLWDDEFQAYRFFLYTDEWENSVKEASIGGNTITVAPSNGTVENDANFPSEVRRAYTEKVKELASENGDLQFALIALTGDDVPELVAEYDGYYIMVFSWSDGKVISLGEEYWPYGAGGNLGYEYLPGENLIRSFDNDYAGAVVYESYYGINFAHELSALPNDQLSIRHFRDTNGNGRPDDDEPYLEEPLYYVGDSEVSKDVYASYQVTGDFEWLGGDNSAEEILAQLDDDAEYESAYGYSDTSFRNEMRYIMDGDEYSWITFYQNGTFSMDVNLYVGGGSLSGSYIRDNYEVHCYVEDRNFQGYIGDDVTEFEFEFVEDWLVYHGETIGMTMDGVPFFVDVS